MIRFSDEILDDIEKVYPGIKKSISNFENAPLPPCYHCASADTARVSIGVVGRSINIAGATTKFKLLANGPKKSNYFCNTCQELFDLKLKLVVNNK